MLLWTVTQTASALGKSTMLTNLAQSPMLLKILGLAQSQGLDEKTDFLAPILFADMLVQIN